MCTLNSFHKAMKAMSVAVLHSGHILKKHYLNLEIAFSKCNIMSSILCAGFETFATLVLTSVLMSSSIHVPSLVQSHISALLAEIIVTLQTHCRAVYFIQYITYHNTSSPWVVEPHSCVSTSAFARWLDCDILSFHMSKVVTGDYYMNHGNQGI